MFKKLSIAIFVVAMSAVGLFAQDAAQTRSLVSGQKYKIEGVVVSKIDESTYVIRDSVGVDTQVVIASNASIKNNSPWGGEKFAATSLVRGLSVKLEGRGDAAGNLSAEKIRFDKSNLMTAQSIEARVTPTETRITAAEQNAQRVSGQIDEMMAISNAARGGARAAQDTADAAVEGINATNQRITSLDEFVVQSTATINFRVNSSVLSPEAKASLDQVAAAATSLRGYTIEITGFASAEGSTARNKELSKRRAQAVSDYLVESHNVPLRRIGTSHGFGELQAVADNTTREGREANRRVEVKLLVSRGMNQNVEVRQVDTDNNER